MVIAALVSFGALFVAWILAPNEQTPKASTASSLDAVPLPATT
ncbi:MAG: hypothetical protein ACR2GO_09755 [Candidatus Limnocylindria bacterium]